MLWSRPRRPRRRQRPAPPLRLPLRPQASQARPRPFPRVPPDPVRVTTRSRAARVCAPRHAPATIPLPTSRQPRQFPVHPGPTRAACLLVPSVRQPPGPDDPEPRLARALVLVALVALVALAAPVQAAAPVPAVVVATRVAPVVGLQVARPVVVAPVVVAPAVVRVVPVAAERPALSAAPAAGPLEGARASAPSARSSTTWRPRPWAA